MLNLTLLAVGRVRDRHLKALCAEYQKRLERYAKVRVVSVRDGKGGSPEAIKAAEADALLSKVPSSAGLIALDERGESLSSEELSRWLSQQATRGRSRWAFVIGGPWGLDERVVDRARLHLSLSAMTFPHELARVLLFEQLYRAMTIWRGEPYHK